MRFYPAVLLLVILSSSFILPAQAQQQNWQTIFEKSKGKASATYAQALAYYRRLDKTFSAIQLRKLDQTDAGKPLHVALYHAEGIFDPDAWAARGDLVILINNGIHAGEPDGVDASMMYLRDVAQGKIKIPPGIVLAIIPAYNIGGMLNRGQPTRVNQDGPLAYGFRGNSRNLDLNRDFLKTDSREARVFARLFQWLKPAVFLDTHVSDGADYQHVMTLLSTQYDKLGGQLSVLMRERLDPALYAAMAGRGFPMIPYVNAWDDHPEKGWTAFYDPPRFGSGYGALWQCLSYVSETHMLKPFDQRVQATYALLEVLVSQAAHFKQDILTARKGDQEALLRQNVFPLSWRPDTTQVTRYWFLGYRSRLKSSEVSNTPRLFYDHTKPFGDSIPIRMHYLPAQEAQAPLAYVVPQGWWPVLARLRDNGVQMQRLEKDTTILLSVYEIQDYQTLARPYEGHYKHYRIRAAKSQQRLQLRRGDFWIPTVQPARRYLIEVLEPEGEDGFFAWNFFDTILQEKEGYSDYRWEDLAGALLRQDPNLRLELERAKATDTALSSSPAAQLRFVFDHSPYREAAYLRYPVYRVE